MDSNGLTAAVLMVFLLVYFALKIGSYDKRSATFDEPIHLTAGYAALVQRDYRVDPTHPPFLRMWAALPLLAMKTGPLDSQRIDRQAQGTWISDAYDYAHDFLYSGREADRNLNAARVMMMLFGALTGLLLYGWAREWLGFYPALLVLVFYLLSPNLAAHATLVTTDFGITCFYFGTIYFFWRTGRNFSRWNLAGLALFFSLACVSKFSAVLLVPAGGLLLGLAVWRGTITPWRAAGIVGLLFVSAFVLIWAVYGFRYAPSATPGWLFRFADEAAADGLKPLPGVTPLMEWIDARHLLPNAYAQGFLLSVALAEPLPGFLAGSINTTGWWYYFPVAFLLKTPLALLILLGAGLAVLALRRAQLGMMNALHLLLPVAVYLGIAMTSSISLGLRHILPIYPFVLLIAATVVWEITTRARHRRALGLALGGLLVFWLAMFARVYPYNLTFFNVLAGGPRHGAKFLVDSNLDWGQHLKLLKDWMEENRVEGINLAYFGMADPEYYDIAAVSLPGSPTFGRRQYARPALPGYVAISSTLLSGVYLQPEWRLFYGGFKRLKPVVVLGNTINVYHLERWPEAAEPDDPGPGDEHLEAHRRLADSLQVLGWHDHAVWHYQHYLQERPDDSRALAGLGQALLQLHRDDDALHAFEQAVAANPPEGRLRSLVVNLLLRQYRTGEAATHAREWARVQPDNPDAHDLLGVALAASGKLDEATVAFTRALQLAPTNATIRRHLDMARSLVKPTK